MATNVPQPTFGSTGFIVPAESAILAGVQADINAAFGGGLNPALATPQGQLASSTAAIIGNSNDAFLFLTQQFDPAYASGRYQDALARAYDLERNPAEPTVVQALCSGAGVTIPVGALAQAQDGNIYTCTQAGTIPAIGGQITLSFVCNNNGPIACPAGSLNIIYQAIPGWDSITNLSAGVEGQDTESTYQFEQRRQQTLAANSIGSLPSILGAVLEVSGVLDAYVTENPTAAPSIVGGVSLVPNSVYVAVVGGAASAVATAIWSRKAPGCNYNGNTSFTVQDTSPGYSPPYPSYVVTWETPADLPIVFAVNIVNTPQVPSNAATLIQNALLNAFVGGDGGSVASIGSLLLASRYFPPVSSLGTWAQIRTLQLGSPNTGSASVLGNISGTTLQVNTVTSGTIATSQYVTGSLGDISPGTQVSAFLGGAGGTGSYTVNISQIIGGTLTANGTATTLNVTAITGMLQIGQILTNGTGIPANTTILGQLSGTTGGIGTYSVSTTLRLPNPVNSINANEQIIMVVANQNSVQVNINQVPILSASDIAVTVT